MNVDNLIEMANRIGEFFAAYPNEVQSQNEIADHLKRFWEPRMRRTLLAHVDTRNGAGLSPLVLSAVQSHRQMLTPPEAPAAQQS